MSVARPLAARAACLAAVGMLAAPGAARADFFDGARKTFTQDIPHFFQDDVPCAFGGQPTSGVRQACHESKPPPTPTTKPPPSPSRPVHATEPTVRH